MELCANQIILLLCAAKKKESKVEFFFKHNIQIRAPVKCLTNVDPSVCETTLAIFELHPCHNS